MASASRLDQIGADEASPTFLLESSMDPENFREILKLCGAKPPDERGYQDLPDKTTLTLYLARAGVGLTVGSVEAVAIRSLRIHARTNKGDLYVVAFEDLFAANIEGGAQPRSARRAGFG
jgi:hypothetical protein